MASSPEPHRIGRGSRPKDGRGEQYQNAWQTKTTDANHQWHTVGLKMEDKPFSMAYKELHHLALSAFPASSLRPLTVPWRHQAACHSQRRLCFLLYLQVSAGNALPASLPKPCFCSSALFLKKALPKTQVPGTLLPSFIPCSLGSVCLALCVRWAGSFLRKQLCLLSLFPPTFAKPL